jgi:hypothetical protein
MFSIKTNINSDKVWGSSNFSRFSMMLTEHYRILAADYLCLGYYCRYTMMTARERESKAEPV